MTIGLLLCLVIGVAGQMGTQKLLALFAIGQDNRDFIANTIMALLVWATYIAFYKRAEKRSVTELTIKSFAPNVLAGFLLGSILQSLNIFVIWLNHDFSVTAVNDPVSVLPLVPSMFVVAVIAEILIIGIVFRITREMLGTYLSMGLVAVIFFFLHLKSAGLIGAVAIAMDAGLLLPAAYTYSKNLWFPIAIHFAWDFMQSAIFGASVSGYTNPHSLLTTKISGPELIRGGYLGPHSSVQAGLLCLLAAFVLIRWSQKQHKIIQPFWRQ
jgi:uncharacterized protein